MASRLLFLLKLSLLLPHPTPLWAQICLKDYHFYLYFCLIFCRHQKRNTMAPCLHSLCSITLVTSRALGDWIFTSCLSFPGICKLKKHRWSRDPPQLHRQIWSYSGLSHFFCCKVECSLRGQWCGWSRLHLLGLCVFMGSPTPGSAGVTAWGCVQGMLTGAGGTCTSVSSVVVWPYKCLTGWGQTPLWVCTCSIMAEAGIRGPQLSGNRSFPSPGHGPSFSHNTPWAAGPRHEEICTLDLCSQQYCSLFCTKEDIWLSWGWHTNCVWVSMLTFWFLCRHWNFPAAKC